MLRLRATEPPTAIPVRHRRAVPKRIMIRLCVLRESGRGRAYASICALTVLSTL